MLRRQLETGDLSPADALAQLTALLAAGAPRAKRAEAYQLVGDIAGRAFDTPWEIAERAAWVLLGAALGVDTASERRALLLAMGRGFRNIWLLPFVHARLDDEDPDTAEAAIHAAGGLGFPGLEAALASFLDEDTAPPLRLAAIRALGRAGAASAAPRLATLALEPPPIGSAALAALTEIRSPAGAAGGGRGVPAKLLRRVRGADRAGLGGIMTRPRTSAFVGVSLDGFLARPDGTIDWLEPFEGVEHGYRAFFDSVDTVVVGRNTYEFVLRMLDSWPYQGKRCVVMTHRAVEGRNQERAFSGEPGTLLDELGAEGAAHVYVDGGVVIRSFLAAGLLDQLTVSVVPSLIGAGLPLFGGVMLESGLTLEHSASFSNGVVQMRYRVDRK